MMLSLRAALISTLESPNPQYEGRFGSSVAGVPDTNGDGSGDVLVGAPGERDAPEGPRGRAYLFNGADGQLLHQLASPRAAAGDEFGNDVAGVPDADGDGAGDLLIGASNEDGGGIFNSGRVYLFSGASGAVLSVLESPRAEINGRFGYAVDGVPDVDGDCRGDLIIGAFQEDAGGEDAGRSYLISGADEALLLTFSSPHPRPFSNDLAGRFGYGVAGVPDTDGDGRGDVLVGAPAEDDEIERTGHAYLYSGVRSEPPPGPVSCELSFQGRDAAGRSEGLQRLQSFRP